MSWPAVALWALILPTALASGPILLYMLFIVNVFMSLQMLPGEGGGANLLPPTIYAFALVMKVALAPGNIMRGLESALDPRRLGLFTAFAVYSALTALLLPRLFAGLLEVVPVSGADLNGASILQPRSGNITQTCYTLISYLTAVAFSVVGSRDDFRRHYMQALVWGAFALIVTGLLDLIAYRFGLSGLLDPFRTASYELLTDVEAAGAKRVVGLTPEASAYGTLCVSAAGALLLLRPLYPRGLTRAIATIAMIGTGVMALLSTSATAYVGGAALACVYLYNLASRIFNRDAAGRETCAFEVGVLACLGLVALMIVVVAFDRVAPLLDVVDKVIFEKSGSLSYMQRSMWSHVGWQAFLDSGGLGAGLGSVRTSNWFISILGSTGVFGALLIFGYFAQKFIISTRGLAAPDAAFLNALRLTLVPFLVMASLAGTIPDIGVTTAAVLGLLSVARPTAASMRDEQRPPIIAESVRGERVASALEGR
jgi:hypothetical protein